MGHVKQHEEVFDEYEGCEGGLQFIENGNILFQLEDDLSALIKNFCFGTLNELFRNGCSIYSFFNENGEIELSLNHDEVSLIVGSSENNFNTKIFVQEILNVGDRFIDFLKKLSSESDDRNNIRAYLIQILNEEKIKAVEAYNDWKESN